jgi:carbon monoxide dehydrogenase subunit G
MVHLLAIGGLTALVLLIGGIAWGWPGSWAPMALVPGVLLGATLGHGINARRGIHPVRAGVIAIGVAFGMMSAALTLAVFRAAVAPPEMTVVVQQRFALPVEDVWRAAGDPERRAAWISWLKDLEPIGSGGPEAVGSRYRAQLDVAQQPVAAEHVVTHHVAGREVAWRVDFAGGSQLQDLEERVTLTPVGDATDLTYRVRWIAPGMAERLASTLFMQPSLEEMATESLSQLAVVGDF